MYSYEDKKRAIELYIKYDKSPTAVVRELGYPCRSMLYTWYKEYVENGGKIIVGKGYRRYSKKQKRAAVRHYLEHGRCMARTMRALGYPSHEVLAAWIDELAPEERKKHRSGRIYTEDEKRSAVVDLVSRKVPASDIAKTYGVAPHTLYDWKRQLLGDGGTRMRKDDLSSDVVELKEQVRTLQDEVRRLELQKDILEGTIELLGKGQGTDPNRLTNAEKTILAIRLKGRYRLSEILRALSLPRSSHQYQVSALAAPDKYADLRASIKRIFHDSDKRYGYRRIHATLRAEGMRISEKVVSRLMAEEGLIARNSKRKRRYSSYAGEISAAPENLICRNFHASAPNELWLTDITEFGIPSGKVYLSPVIDCFDGMVVSWSMSTSPDAKLANSMLKGAVATLKPGEHPIIHNDRGCHYRWPGWIKICEEHGLTRSMSAKGCTPDNAACEGFFGRLKVEFFYGRRWDGWSIDEFMDALDSYIHWYNEVRIKGSLGWMSPLEYRQSLKLTA